MYVFAFIAFGRFPEDIFLNSEIYFCIKTVCIYSSISFIADLETFIHNTNA